MRLMLVQALICHKEEVFIASLAFIDEIHSVTYCCIAVICRASGNSYYKTSSLLYSIADDETFFRNGD